MTLEISRRGLLGMFAAGTAAAIIRTPGLLMPIKPKLVVRETIINKIRRARIRFSWPVISRSIYGWAS